MLKGFLDNLSGLSGRGWISDQLYGFCNSGCGHWKECNLGWGVWLRNKMETTSV